MRIALKIAEKLDHIEKIVNADYNNGRTLKHKLLQKITEKGKCPYAFCKELMRLKEIL